MSTYRNLPSVRSIIQAYQKLKNVVLHTPLQKNLNYSEQYQANVYFKREDLQVVRSYKIRGAYHKISSLKAEETERGIVCASAGNHAQGVAYACRALGIHGKIFMPNPTPEQKISQTRMFGKEWIEIILSGDTFDDAYAAALEYCKKEKSTLVHPFDDEKIILGQSTVGFEILEDAPEKIDYVFLPVGGGGLSAGVGAYLKQINPEIQIIGVEPAGAPAMQESLKAGKIVRLDSIDKFVDGAAVGQVGELNFAICRQVLETVETVAEGQVCSSILKLYNQDAIVVEPAGAMSVAVLEQYRDRIQGKNVVCIISGGNNDITRMEEIKERSLLYEKLKHYFIINFPQRPGALKEFVMDILGPQDDISHFEYTKKNNREKGPALVGVELSQAGDFEPLLGRMQAANLDYEILSQDSRLFRMLI